MALGKTPRESTKAKMRQFADLWRGGPDEVRGDASKCYATMHPKASKKVCEAMGSEYLNHPYTQAYLKEKSDKVAESADITQERILKELAALAFFDVRNLYHNDGTPKAISDLDEATARSIIGLDAVNIGNGEQGIGQVLKYKLSDKRGALELLGKHLRMFVDRSENTNITMSHEEWLDSLK